MFSNSTVISRSTDPTYSTLSQIELYYLIPQSNLIQQSHILNGVKNSIVWSRFTFSSLSTVLLIQYCHKFGCISSFTFISLSTVQTYSKVSQIHLFYLIPQSDLIPQSHILKQCHKFNSLISFYILILFNSSIYSKCLKFTSVF